MTSGEHTRGHTELPWQDAAEKLCAAMENRVIVTARQAAETLYETVLTETQSYLRENVVFNLNSELTSLRFTCDRLGKEATAHESAVTDLVKALEEARDYFIPRAKMSVVKGAIQKNFEHKLLDKIESALAQSREAQAGGGA